MWLLALGCYLQIFRQACTPDRIVAVTIWAVAANKTCIIGGARGDPVHQRYNSRRRLVRPSNCESVVALRLHFNGFGFEVT